jgi:hypothetical protein
MEVLNIWRKVKEVRSLYLTLDAKFVFGRP